MGNNINSALGDGITGGQTDVPVAVTMPLGTTFSAISTGGPLGLALDTSGQAWAWGDNSFGELGDGTSTTASAVPVAVKMPSGTVFTAISGGEGNGLALDTHGEAWAWGSNLFGELGDGTNTGPEKCYNADPCSTVPVPVNMPGGITFVAVASGQSFGLALSATTGQPLTITGPLPQPLLGVPYTAKLSAVGGTAPYRWSVLSGSLPSGLSLSRSGHITGTPSTAGVFEADVQVQDATGQAVSTNLFLTTKQPTYYLTGETIVAHLAQPFHNEVAFLVTDGIATASDFSASIAWGDGTTSAGTVVAVSRSEEAGLAAGGFTEFKILGSHTYPDTLTSKTTITVDSPQFGEEVSPGGVLVVGKAPTGNFSVLPVNPTTWSMVALDNPANVASYFVPAVPNKYQNRVKEYVWHFGDGAEVIDEPNNARHMLVLAQSLAQNPNDMTLRNDAYLSGMIPASMVALGTTASPDADIISMMNSWLNEFPFHIVPHVFTSVGSVPVALTETDAANQTGTGTQSITVLNTCNPALMALGFANPVLLGLTTCEAQQGLAFLTTFNRSPDYLSVSFTKGADVVSGGVTVSVTHTGEIFVTSGGAVGVDPSLNPGEVVSVSSGYVGTPATNPLSDPVINNFLTGPGLGVEIDLGPGSFTFADQLDGTFGETYGISGQLALGVTAGLSCGVDLGKPPFLNFSWDNTIGSHGLFPTNFTVDQLTTSMSQNLARLLKLALGIQTVASGHCQ